MLMLLRKVGGRAVVMLERDKYRDRGVGRSKRVDWMEVDVEGEGGWKKRVCVQERDCWGGRRVETVCFGV